MSMNLTLHDGEEGPEIDLWQTPTWVTWVCLSYDPDTGLPDGGHRGVRRRYIHWVNSHLDGIWKDKEDFEWEKKRIREHVKIVSSVKNPYFSYI